MDAVTYQAKGAVEFGDIKEPELGADDVLIKVRASGICHTDIDILYGRYGNSTYPITPGHEYAGDVVQCGSGVTQFSEGDRVVVDPNFHCGTCRACKKGLTNLCSTLGAYGVTKAGGFANLSAVHQDNVIAIGDMPYDIAALAEPVGCVLNGVDAVNAESVENALIFGSGPIGLLMALSLRTRGVKDITMVDIAEKPLELAQTYGLGAIKADSSELENYEESVDLTVDATGIPSVASGLIQYTANGGCVLYFGVCPPGKTIELSPHEIFRRQLRIVGTHSLNHNIPAALDAIKLIGDDIGRLISHRVPLSEIEQFLSGKGAENTLKVQSISD